MTATPSAVIYMVAGEPSGDRLGAGLMRALHAAEGDRVSFRGVGGPAMMAEGLRPLFPMADIAVMGVSAVLGRLPLLLRRIRETARDALAASPAGLVLIDSPDFCHRVARQVRAARPDIPIVGYVSPTVWAWRPGRARALRPLLDHLMALLPFEPAAHARLGGPPCTYVGHPLIERAALLHATVGSGSSGRTVLVLPGSRRSEIRHLMPQFGGAVARLAAADPRLRFVLPAVPHVEPDIRRAMEDWPIKPEIVRGEADKWQAFREARVALAASGTVTLELALAGVPTVAAYMGSAAEAFIARRLVNLPSAILPNLVVGRNAVPEFMQEECRPDRLAAALLPLLDDGRERQIQLEAFKDLAREMGVGSLRPTEAAAAVVMATIRGRNTRR